MDVNMEAVKRRMMADLGLAHREQVTGANVDSKGRPVHEDAREKEAIRAQVSARQAEHVSNGAGSGAEERAARLHAWNLPSNFERDEVAEQMTDHCSGQGHRAALNREMTARSGGDNRRNAVDAGGEERRLWLESRSGNQQNHGHHRAFSGTHRAHDRGRLSPSVRTPRHNRAPSPRRFGTVRFGPGAHRADTNTDPPPPFASAALQAAAAVRAAAANGTPARTSVKNDVTATATKPSIPTSVKSEAAALKPKPTSPNGVTAAPPTPASDGVRAQVYYNIALWHAAHPGEACDRYHQQYPDRLQYLGAARDHLIREAITLAKEGDETETAQYLEAHPERKWMVDAAEKAKVQIQQGDEVEIETYCKAHPKQRAFLRFAEAVFKPKEKTLKVNGTHQFNDKIAPAELQALPSVAGVEISSPENHGPTTPSQTSDTTISVSEANTDAAGSLSPTAAMGTLAATLFDAKGKLLAVHQALVRAPVQVSVSVASRKSTFDPRDLIHCIEALAQSMEDRTRGLDGVHIADDGLWVEEDEML